MDTVKPLAGLRVVDFTWIAAGPLGTRILANFGAQVIKVESRAHMDSLRYDLRPRGSTSENTSAIFAQVNPGKLSVSLDLSRDEGRDLVRRLIATADLVTNNFRPGALERMGLGYEALREIKPDIVLLNMPGCGREGPWSQVATMGNLVLAASGWNSLTGFAGQPPRGLSPRKAPRTSWICVWRPWKAGRPAWAALVSVASRGGRYPVARTHGAEIAHPELALGTEYPDLWFIHDKAEVAVCRDAGGDETPWFRGPSP